MNAWRNKLFLAGFAIALSACAHYPSQYSTYSSSNSYYPAYGGGYPQRYSQYSYYPARPPAPPVYYGYGRPYGGGYPSNNYYHQNNNVYNPPVPNRPWGYGHEHHEHHGYIPPNGYGNPPNHWRDHDGDHDHHSNWNGANWDGGHHDDDRFHPRPQPITIRNEDRQFIHIDNHIVNRGNNQPSVNWNGGRNNNQIPQPGNPNFPPTHGGHDRPRENPQNVGWGNHENHRPNPGNWGGNQPHDNPPPAPRPQFNFASNSGQPPAPRQGQGHHGEQHHPNGGRDRDRFGR